ncbi:MAG: DUF177 domain-containing protein [Clostridia bacterium]|nr:DUF177 domain-containing protein [Clostridia bacterium]
MIIDLKALKQKGLKTCDFEFSFSPDNRLLSLPQSSFDGDARIKGVVEVYDDEAFVSGKITYGIKTVCSRCLSPVNKSFTIDFDERFLSMTNPEPDEDCFRYLHDKIDLSNMVDELIMTDMPYAVFCKEDCKGLCPSCGKNLNDGDCGCEIL